MSTSSHINPARRARPATACSVSASTPTGRAQPEREVFQQFAHAVRLLREQQPAARGALLLRGAAPVIGEHAVQAEQECGRVGAVCGERAGQIDQVRLPFGKPHAGEFFQRAPRLLTALRAFGAAFAYLFAHGLRKECLRAVVAAALFRKYAFDLAEGGGNFKQFFACPPAAAVDARAGERLFLVQVQAPFQCAQPRFGRQRKQQAGNERNEHSQVKPCAREGRGGGFRAEKIGEIAQDDRRKERAQRRGDLSAPAAARRRRRRTERSRRRLRVRTRLPPRSAR